MGSFTVELGRQSWLVVTNSKVSGSELELEFGSSMECPMNPPNGEEGSVPNALAIYLDISPFRRLSSAIKKT